ncbi:hypothetical protein Ssi02_32690 [Sinosporangium siamense]|uniref:Uncharacterized protein n=1 Tax=Sinosporangium siamense TaxID=1367973 RepID=A0A919RG72_9ACTN|nr:hypothetical protein [Sinosporangium siamense]GII93038.1 hypothetical protein Ssi02_32690 [Sinosporangium siamense]
MQLVTPDRGRQTARVARLEADLDMSGVANREPETALFVGRRLSDGVVFFVIGLDLDVFDAGLALVALTVPVPVEPDDSLDVRVVGACRGHLATRGVRFRGSGRGESGCAATRQCDDSCECSGGQGREHPLAAAVREYSGYTHNCCSPDQHG